MSYAVTNRNVVERVNSKPGTIVFVPDIAPAAYFCWKDAFGRCLAVVLLILGSPIMLSTILLVRLTSPGPSIFRQTRVGKNGRIYTMYKIRSMRQDAEVKSGPVWTTTKDPRITRVGRFIRTLHLDEFPQLFNVLKGEMALIGPRPERPEFVDKLAREIPGYLDRLSVRPGITGLAQINLPPDSDLDSVRETGGGFAIHQAWQRVLGLADSGLHLCAFAWHQGGVCCAHVWIGLSARSREGRSEGRQKERQPIASKKGTMLLPHDA